MRPALLGGSWNANQAAKGGPRDPNAGMQGDGQVVPAALNQNLLRQDLKNFMGNGAGTDQAVTQKFLEEYLNRQKQGLVDNIVSQYAHDAQKLDQINFSNAII